MAKRIGKYKASKNLKRYFEDKYYKPVINFKSATT